MAIDESDLRIARANVRAGKVGQQFRPSAVGAGRQQQWGGTKNIAGVNFQSLVSIQQDDDKAMPFVVTIGAVEPLNPQSITPGTRITGRVHWGSSGGAQAAALFDIANGVTFSVPGSSIEIDAALEAAAANPVSVSAMVCRGAIGGSVRPMVRSIFIDNGVNQIAPAASTVFDLPPFTSRVRVVRRLYTIPMTIFLNSAIQDEINVTVGASNECPWIEVPSGITAIRLTNNDAANDLWGRIICELSI